MDITFIAGTSVLLLTAALLILISSAEAVMIASGRGRARTAPGNGAVRPPHGYGRQRHELLRALSAATVATIAAAAVTAAFLVLRDGAASAASATAVGAVTVLVAALLRQSARTLALLYPERAGALLERPTRALRLLFTPLAWLAEAPVAALLRALGRTATPPEPDPAEELTAVLESTGEAEGDGFLAEERRMMRGIMAMSSQSVREIMSPRMDLRAVSTEASVGDVMRLIIESGFSRIPLYEDSIDRVIGIIYAKDLLAHFQAGDVHPDLRKIARPPYFVPETKRANELLSEMRRDQMHMAVALDEYGGTAGVVTVEDLLEEIVGEIADEYDSGEVDIRRVSDDQAIVDARLPLDELNELFGTAIDSEDFDTVGGLIFSLLGRLANPGDQVSPDGHGLRLRVLSVVGRRIKRVRVERVETADEAEEAAAS